MLKAFLKTVLPRPAIVWAAGARDRAWLALHPRRITDPGNLLPGERLDLAGIFLSNDIRTSWERDHGMIKAVYEDGEIFGGVNPGDRRALYYLLRALRPRSVLEIGTHVGASTVHMAMALRANGAGHIITVDIADVNDGQTAQWRVRGLARSPRDVIRELGCAERVTFLTQPAQDYMHQTIERFDLIFLDGDHSPSAVYGELPLAMQRLNPGGLILLHDYYPAGTSHMASDRVIEGPFLALKRACRENPAIGVSPLGHLPWQTNAGRSFTTLAAVTRATP